MQDTNSIALTVKNGGDIMMLWEAVRRFAVKQAFQWLYTAADRAGVTMDDLEQTAFLALLAALPGYDEQKGAFLTWYNYYLKNAYKLLCGLRTERDKQDPINTSISLDEPVVGSDDETLTIGSLIEDPQAARPFETSGLSDAIQAALATLPEDERAAIIGKFWYEIPQDKRIFDRAIRHLRHPKTRQFFNEYWR